MEGWHGWDDYARFYDWENARTLGRRDVAFWRSLARRIGGRALELGCGTGRVLAPLGRSGVSIVGVDRSAAMLKHARRRLRRVRSTRATLIRGDIRYLPFRDGQPFDLVLAPYGILQSLLSTADLDATLAAVARVCRPGGTFGLDLVPDVPNWAEYRRRVSVRGRRGRSGPRVTLVESVRQDRRRRLTIFDQEFLEGHRGRPTKVYRFSLTFRTLTVPTMRRRLERAGFEVQAVLGDYDGAPWDPRAPTWLILATRAQPQGS